MNKPLDTISDEITKRGVMRIFDDILDPAFDWTKKKYKLFQFFREGAKNYIEFICKTLYFKTIASNDQRVYIDDIYVPLIIKWEKDVGLAIDDNVTLESEDTIVIKGLAGQGKSTIIRKILANILSSEKRIPIFYELKYYNGGSLIENMAQHLKKNGIDIDESALCSIINDRDSVVLLDGFDEVDPALREELLYEISCVSNYNCKFVCSTRPDTELDSLPIKTFEVQMLKPNQVYQIIEKTATDIDKANSLIFALKNSRLHSSEDSVLKTPILVALLCVSYNLGEEIPESLSQFYKNIFDTVFYKHDNLKGRVNRVRYWNDNRQTYLSVFECFSFASLIRHGASLEKREALRCMKESLGFHALNDGNEEKIFEELCRITNLIFADGFNNYRFAHKSIQEYYAASFIAHFPDSKKKEFYTKAWKQFGYHSLVNGVLFFLEEIDYYNFVKHYLVPSISDVLDLDGGPIDDKHLSVPDRLLDLFFDEVSLQAEFIKIRHKRSSSNSGAIEKKFIGFHFDRYSQFPEVYNRLFTFAWNQFFNLQKEKRHILSIIQEHGSEIGGGYKSISLRTYSEIRSKHLDVKGILGMAASVLFKKRYNDAISQLENRSAHLDDSDLFDFST